MQHYESIDYFNISRPLAKIQAHDNIKSQLCKEINITYIPIPHWWDQKFSSLEATLFQYRPDLFNKKPSGEQIPINKPSDSTQSNKRKKNLIQSKLMLATDWDNEIMDPTGWWMSEKYDGIRAYWDGSQMFMRTGRKVPLPEKFKDRLPSVALDGELW